MPPARRGVVRYSQVQPPEDEDQKGIAGRSNRARLYHYRRAPFRRREMNLNQGGE
jgi:hypothetical protein